MTVTFTWQSIIVAGGVVGALIALASHFGKAVRWVDRQKAQDTDIEALRSQHTEDMEQLREEIAKELGDIKTEQTLLTYGVLACLKGLKEQGCNGPVTKAIEKIDKYLNKKAHDQT